MNHAELVARRLADALTSLGHSCSHEGSTVQLTRWSLQVHVIEGQTKRNDHDATVIMPAIVATHGLLPHGFARELGVGVDKSIERAATNVAANWMLLFFPLMKFLFEDPPHDCTVHEEPIDLPNDRQPYRLVASPIWSMGFEESGQPDGMSQSLLWNTFSETLLPTLSPGVHHIRCYVASMPDGCNADVFVDGTEWPEGGNRLRELARKFPAPDVANPIRSLKQHLLVRPSDLETGARREEEWQIARWTSALADHMDPTSSAILPNVLLALITMGRATSDEQQRQALGGKSLPAPLVDELISFLQSAAARVLLKGRAEFSETYYLVNSRTRQAVERRYDETPIFATGAKAFGLLWGRGLAVDEIQAVANCSAEMSGVRQAMAQTGKFEGGRFTQMVHSTSAPVSGVDIDVLLAKQQSEVRARRASAQAPPSYPSSGAHTPAPCTKPWWRFW